LEKKAKETILENISNAISLSVNQLITKIRNFNSQASLPLTLNNFLEFNHLSIEAIYAKDSWSRLCQRAGVIKNYENTNEKQIYSAIRNKWLSTRSGSYFKFVLTLAEINFQIKISSFNEEEKTMLLMLHYDIWQNSGGFQSLELSIRQIGKNTVLVEEIKEDLNILIDKIDFKEIDINLPYQQPLKLHARYTRDQILSAFGLSTFEKKSSNREGAAENSSINTEILFINLIKSEEDFSPTTMYDDYAISERLFHWQTHNAYRPEIGKGLSYIEQASNRKIVLLFVRERAKDENGNTMGYVFVGEGKFQSSEGSKPMSINWELKEPIPHYLWKASAKMAIG
jgi:hypothetical protein